MNELKKSKYGDYYLVDKRTALDRNEFTKDEIISLKKSEKLFDGKIVDVQFPGRK